MSVLPLVLRLGSGAKSSLSATGSRGGDAEGLLPTEAGMVEGTVEGVMDGTLTTCLLVQQRQLARFRSSESTGKTSAFVGVTTASASAD